MTYQQAPVLPAPGFAFKTTSQDQATFVLPNAALIFDLISL